MKALITAFASAIATIGIPSLAMAQTASATDKSAPVYRSAFSGYRGMTDEKVEWRGANDAVGRIGGWRTYLRESQSTENQSTDTAPAPTAPQNSKPAAPAGRGAGPHRH